MSDEFKIPTAEFPDGNEVISKLLRIQQAMLAECGNGSETRSAIPPKVIKAMADIATYAWKATARLKDAGGVEQSEVEQDEKLKRLKEVLKRIHRHTESIAESFREIGLEVKDHTGDAFDYGLPLKVITTRPTQGITRESVIETIKPTIKWQNQIIQMGEVVIATPA